MLSALFSRPDLACPCTECTTFLRPFPKSPSATLIPRDLFLSSLPLTSTLTPALTPYSTAPSIPGLRPTLAPPPSFLSTPSLLSGKQGTPSIKAPLLSLNTAWSIPATNLLSAQTEARAKHRATLASRSLWAQLSSPLDSAFPPLSAKTPGLAVCAAARCARKVVPGFGRGVCGECEEAVRGAVEAMRMASDDEKRVFVSEARREGGVTPLGSTGGETGRKILVEGGEGERREVEDKEEGEIRSALPSTPLSVHLPRTHSLHPTPGLGRAQSTPPIGRSKSTKPAQTPLFALPNASCDVEKYEKVMATGRYTMDFPALPGSRSASRTESRTKDSKSVGKWNSRKFWAARESSSVSLRMWT
ncbi:hypothetical protein SVAN01_08611 [Stagonosporopsis vannaccii]|nr:hypothetical protein SVAN01_08611 [Stagonosporopsis vannaccii]